jgi:hypothetical protein
MSTFSSCLDLVSGHGVCSGENPNGPCPLYLSTVDSAACNKKKFLNDDHDLAKKAFCQEDANVNQPYCKCLARQNRASTGFKDFSYLKDKVFQSYSAQNVQCWYKPCTDDGVMTDSNTNNASQCDAVQCMNIANVENSTLANLTLQSNCNKNDANGQGRVPTQGDSQVLQIALVGIALVILVVVAF